MANVASDWLLLFAPEFTDNPLSPDAIEAADLQVKPGLCGNLRPQLVAYLAAHILTIGGRASGASGAIASVTEGKTSITYNNAKPYLSTGGLSDTSYGREYDRLRRSCIMAVRTRITDISDCGC